MNVQDFVKRFISRGAVIYTAGSLSILLFALNLPENAAATILSPEPFVYFAIFAYLLSLGSALYASGRFSATTSRIIHAACYNIGFFCFLLLCQMEFAYSAIFTAAFAIIYTVSVILAGVFKKGAKTPAEKTVTEKTVKGKKEKAKPQSTYTSRFS